MIREVIFTSYLFDGYPAALEGFRLFSELTGFPAGAEDAAYTPEAVEQWRLRGERLCRAVYGPQFERLTKHVREFGPELADAMIVEGYGKTLSREGIDVRLRELCVTVILALKGRERQLVSHILGSLRLGATVDDVRAAISVIEPIAGEERFARSVHILEEASRRFVRP